MCYTFIILDTQHSSMYKKIIKNSNLTTNCTVPLTHNFKLSKCFTST